MLNLYLSAHDFSELCKDLDSEHQLLLFYIKVRWLSKENVLNRVFELREELKMFLDIQNEETVFFSDPLWEPRFFFFYFAYSTCRLFRGPHERPRPLVVQGAVYSGTHRAHAAPSVLPSHEDAEDEVMGSMSVILHHSAVTEKSQHVAAWDRTWDHRLRTAAR